MVTRPYYLFRPSQILRRLSRYIQSPCIRVVETPWGIPITINAGESIGNAIWRTGVYEMETTEAIARLLDEGDVAVDIGANVGYYTGLMAKCVGPQGAVIALEAHPLVYTYLSANARLIKNTVGVDVQLHRGAPTDREGEVALALSDARYGETFAQNYGVARVSQNGNGPRVPGVTLDAILEDADVCVVKIDLEGHELEALHGASQLLGQGRIDHIVYEDHEGAESDVATLLHRAGYTCYRLGQRWNGPELLPPATDRARSANFLATRFPDEVQERFSTRGWLSLRGAE